MFRFGSSSNNNGSGNSSSSSNEDLPGMVLASPPLPPSRSRERRRKSSTSRSSRRSSTTGPNTSRPLVCQPHFDDDDDIDIDHGGNKNSNMNTTDRDSHLEKTPPPVAVRRRTSQRDVSFGSGGDAGLLIRRSSSLQQRGGLMITASTSFDDDDDEFDDTSPDLSPDTSPDSSPGRRNHPHHKKRQQQHPNRRSGSSQRLSSRQSHEPPIPPPSSLGGTGGTSSSQHHHRRQDSQSSSSRASSDHPHVIYSSSLSSHHNHYESSSRLSLASTSSSPSSAPISPLSNSMNSPFMGSGSEKTKKVFGCKTWSIAVLFGCMVVLSLVGMVLLTQQADNSMMYYGGVVDMNGNVIMSSHHKQQQHAEYDQYLTDLVVAGGPHSSSAAGLRGKIVQGRWDGSTNFAEKKHTTFSVSASNGGKEPTTSSKPKQKKTKPSESRVVSEDAKTNKSTATTASVTEGGNPTRSASSSSATATPSPLQVPARLTMHLPPSVPASPYKYDKVDPNMYDKTSTSIINPKSNEASQNIGSAPPRTNHRHTPYPRIFAFDPSLTRSAPKKLKTYPADFTDNTQLYSILPSDDERLSHMELRAPYSEGECVPMQDWQTTYNPLCNGMHELGMESLGDDENGMGATLFGTGGFWRYAWRLDLGPHDQAKQSMDTVVLKTLKFQHNFEDAHFEHDRIDAVAMERLTSSPHVINVFGFCGHSVITEFADGPRVGALADKARKKPLERLRIARDVANGLADVHGIDGDGNATFVHLDVNPANVVSIGGTLKLNDFNIGIIRRWNTTSNEPCGFPAQYPNPQWRSPEEAREEQNLTEKVDIFSLGHIFFRLICGHEPWNKLEPGGKPSKEEINRKVQKGVMPFIPESVKESKDPEVVAIRDAMISCYAVDPKERPAARQIARTLDRTLTELTKAASAKTTTQPTVVVESNAAATTKQR